MKRKEFKKVKFPLNILLKKMYKNFGYDMTIFKIENMKEPTEFERLIMIDYIKSIHEKQN